MSAEQESFYNLAERIKDAFSEIDSDIATDLFKSDSGYMAMRKEIVQLERDFPFIEKLTEGSGAISLTAEEHKALVRYVDLTRQMESAERRQIYFRGHTDSFAYLRRIGAI